MHYWICAGVLWIEQNMDCKGRVRLFLKCILLLCFIGISVNAVKTWFKEETSVGITYEPGRVPVPSITICPYDLDLDVSLSYKTLPEAYNSNLTFDVSEIAEARMEIMESTRFFEEESEIDLLQNRSNIQTRLSVAQRRYKNVIMKCVTLDPPFLEVQSKNVVIFLTINMTNRILFIEVHEPGQSSFNHEWRWDRLSFLRAGVDQLNMLTAQVSEMIPTKNTPCIPDPSGISKSHCMDRFMESKLKCKLPWTTKSNGTRFCDKPNDLNGFINVYRKFKTAELKQFGCMAQSCRQTQWNRVWVSEDKTEPDIGKFLVSFQSNMPTTFIRHSLSYGFANFVADFGGYLGLLLGGSLLAFFDIIWNTCDNVKLKLQSN